MIIAHRGGSLEAPENTLAALRHGVRSGATWQEVDVGLSSDDVPVILHDDDVTRTTDGTGNLTDWPVSHLSGLHAGAPRWNEEGAQVLRGLGVLPPDFAGKYPDERVPTLAQALQVPRVRLMLELKQSTKPETLVRTVAQAVTHAGMQDRVALASFDPVLVAMARKLAPELPRIGVLEDLSYLPHMLKLEVAAIAVYTGLVAAARPLVPEPVALWTWTVYTPEAARAAAQAGADGLITDIPAKLVAARKPGGLGDA